MHQEHWERIRELFHEALDLPESERGAYLTANCPDAEIRTQVEALLANANTGVLDSPAVAGLREAIEGALSDTAGATTQTAPSEGEPPDGTIIGRYRLLEKIGEGGMGEVWLAEQREPVRRRVALKLVKAGMNTHEVMARFESERQALALMDHPGIARVFDADSTPQGAPYFVMEYVAGLPITTYCDNHRLSTRERLQLFIEVCEAVQHAHQKAIIHRDLKPSNILVTEVNGRPMPKIIDFGVAKALTQKLTADTLFTRMGVLVGTPEYMSPEQANSSGEDIDTRTDIYSLGIVLYELLAGVPPLSLKSLAFEEFLRRLREDDPPKPSTRIRNQDAATSTDIARKRRTEPPTLARQISGDLDLIALKALEKERGRRYGSPADFAADIARYLNHEAVLAAPRSAFYRARKFVRRHRGPLAAACVLAVVLVVAAAVSIRESIRANREAGVSEAVTAFLQNDVLSQASAATQSGPSTKPDPDLKVRTALDRAATRIQGKFENQPEVEASIRDTMGETYIDLGMYADARPHLERALQLHRRTLGARHPKTLRTMSRLGHLAKLQGRYAEAEALLTQALDGQKRVLGPAHRETLNSTSYLSDLYDGEGKYPLAEAIQSQMLEAARNVFGPERPETVDAMRNLAWTYVREGKYAKSEKLYGQTLDADRRVLGPEHPLTLADMGNFATLYYEEAKYPDAEALYSETVAIERRVLGQKHPYVLATLNGLGLVYKAEGKYAEAESVFRELVDSARQIFGSEHPHTLVMTNNLGFVCTAQGKYPEARDLLLSLIVIARRVFGPEHPNTVLTMHNLADVYAGEGKYDQANALFSQVLEIRRRVLGAEHPDTLFTLSTMAFQYQRQGRYDLAKTYFEQDLAGLRHTAAADEYIMETLTDLASVHTFQGGFAEAEPLARQAMTYLRDKQPENWQTYRAEAVLGASLVGQKKYEEAEPLLIDGYRGMMNRQQRLTAADRYHLECARDWIVRLYRSWGKPEKAAEWSNRDARARR